MCSIRPWKTPAPTRCVRAQAQARKRPGVFLSLSSAVCAYLVCLRRLRPSPAAFPPQAWDASLRAEIEAEAAAIGGSRALHAHVSRDAPGGDVYLMMAEFAAAGAVLAAFHGRTFAGRTLSATPVPIEEYLARFPEIAKLAAA